MIGPRGILNKGRVTSEESQSMDSAIDEHSLALNSSFLPLSGGFSMNSAGR